MVSVRPAEVTAPRITRAQRLPLLSHLGVRFSLSLVDPIDEQIEILSQPFVVPATIFVVPGFGASSAALSDLVSGLLVRPQNQLRKVVSEFTLLVRQFHAGSNDNGSWGASLA